ncbi:hypothetical protein [Streptomyces sp. SYSU K217416]
MIEIVDSSDAGRAGVYAVGSWGWVYYRERYDTGVWKERGYTLRLMEDGRQIAYTEALCSRDEWEESARGDLDGIEPWLRTLRVLRGGPQAAGVERLGDSIRATRHAAEELADVDAWDAVMTDFLGEYADSLTSAATGDEISAARLDGSRLHYGTLARLMVERLESDIRRSQLVALAAAPDPAAHPIHERWELPRPEFFSGHAEDAKRVAPYVMWHLLAGWRATQDMKGNLLVAAETAGVTKTEMHTTTGLARTTIDRLLTLA